MRARILIVALAALAVVIAVVAGGGGDDASDRTTGRPAGTTAAPPAKSVVRLPFVYSTEKVDLLVPLVKRYNAQRHRIGGSTVQVDGRGVASGEVADAVAAGRLKPAVWSPASSLWGRLLNYQADRAYVPETNPSLVRSPLVIAMWEPMARALGWPRQRVGFEQILRLATSRQGWKAYGHEEFGTFKLGHTNPDFSTSGLSAVAAEYFAAAGKREGLTVADVERRAVRDRIRTIERSIVHYGDTTPFFATQLQRYGPAYASAVAMEEVTLLDFNRGRRGTKLVALYPREGTFDSDSPLIVLRAPWVSTRQRAAARDFLQWLRGQVTPGLAGRFGFRAGDPRAAVPPEVSRQNGADPAQPAQVLAPPQPEVLDRIRRAWRQDRKPANIMLVVDTSESMSEEDRLPQAKRGLRAFLRLLSPKDRVGLIRFSSSVRSAEPIRPFRQARQALLEEVDKLFPDGDTALYEATNRGVAAVRALNDRTRINAVVLLTDGVNTVTGTSAEDVIEPLEAHSGTEGLTVRVFTIAYGSTANQLVLERIAEASGGKPYEGDPDEIQDVYRQIASFF
jgi:Ca-activated chloride channel family protein